MSRENPTPGEMRSNATAMRVILARRIAELQALGQGRTPEQEADLARLQEARSRIGEAWQLTARA